MPIVNKGDYPRPDFIRKEYVSLNGEWDFCFDRNREYEKAENPEFTQRIRVPFCYQSEKSGINCHELIPVVWYRRRFSIDGAHAGKTVLLKFGAVDYEARVWLNGVYLGGHTGGYTPFEFDITPYLRPDGNELVVMAKDEISRLQPRGKQIWKENGEGCHYTPVSGIWQEVWLEFTSPVYIDSVRITPDVDHFRADVEVFMNRTFVGDIRLSLTKDGAPVSEQRITCCGERLRAAFQIPDLDIKNSKELWWSPAYPNLFDLTVTLVLDGRDLDEVETYFGMRKVSVGNGRVLLNNCVIYQRLILDQGYWPDTLLTPPDGDALRRDVELTLALGFNGARKHQKIEDPRYYYWADKMGVLVWGELPSAYEFHESSMSALLSDMGGFIRRDFNHPCIITWVPLNESWGVRDIAGNARQQDFARLLYYFIKSLDGTRLVSTNDGWEMVNPSDICGVHNYRKLSAAQPEYNDLKTLFACSSYVSNRLLYSPGNAYAGQPVLLTEYGGVSLSGKAGWGYSRAEPDEESYIARLSADTAAINANHIFQGYCYTQLTDVFQEANGLLYMDRKPKADMEKLRAIFS